MQRRADDILSFWFDEVGPAGWYDVDEDRDAEVRARFGDLWEATHTGSLNDWICKSHTSLALVLLLDQFPRNMFRGSGRAFETDRRALAFTKRAIAVGHDHTFDMPKRQFYYLPFMHAEVVPEQDRGVRLFLEADEGEDNLRHARAHRWVIRRFGRFPYRNEAIGRDTTEAEAEFLEAGGYRAALDAVSD